jgi:acetyl esterase/lipase/pimeloyl-ACP methyl ester carboxylesterase
MAWLGAGILTAGMSAATLAGAGLAGAEDGAAASAGGDTASESANPSEAEADSKPDDNEPAAPDPVETDADDEQATGDGEGAEEPDDDAEDADRPRNRDRSARDEQTTEDDDRTAASSSADDAPDKTLDESVDVEVDVEEASDSPAGQDPDPDEDTVTVTQPAVSEDVQVEAESNTAPSEPSVVETIASAVSSVVTTILNPSAEDSTPVDPGAQPQVWTLAAAARREFETAFESPSLVEQVAPVENSLTYTPPPTFQDQLTLVFYEVMRVVSKVTGVNTTIVLGSLLATRTPPFFLTFGLDTRRTVWTAEDGTEWQGWEFAPPEPTEKTVLAFHGGGILEPTILHWIDYTNMARETGATVVVPLFPVSTTPDGAAKEVIPEAADFISHQIELHGAENVSVYADSGGSLIAMSAVRQLLLTRRPVPSSMVFVGLPADYSSSNPDIRKIDDPLYDIDNLGAWDSHWLDGITDRQDPLVSPLFFEPEVLKALPQTTLYVGTREILYPDTLLLHQRAVNEGAPISVVVGIGLIHGWTLSGAPIPTYSQTVAVRPDVYRQLGLTEDAAVANLPEPEAITALAAAEEPLPQPTLIHTVGSFAWGLFDAVAKAFSGPATVPTGSTVTVVRSTLEIDCGDGYTTEADWYFPAGEEPPTKLIYLQHGAFATAGMYNGTAAELAERNNAIVVAPTITSNYFACDACALGGDPMHAAVAKLFLDDREALLASARAAGFEGTELPQRFVIAGHSGGGQLAGGAAGYYAEFAPAGELHNLAGVLLLDTSPVGGAVERGVRKVPLDIPVYAISAAPGVMNTYGGVDGVLAELRPGEFVGVQLVGGVHGDAWQTTNALAELIVGVGTGFPAPENVEAVQVLAQGWINDWYTPEDPDTGFYGELGSVIDIPTDEGTAEAHVLPAPHRQLNVIELFVKTLFESTVLLTALQTCAEDPSATAASAKCSAESAEEAV